MDILALLHVGAELVMYCTNKQTDMPDTITIFVLIAGWLYSRLSVPTPDHLAIGSSGAFT